MTRIRKIVGIVLLTMLSVAGCAAPANPVTQATPSLSATQSAQTTAPASPAATTTTALSAITTETASAEIAEATNTTTSADFPVTVTDSLTNTITLAAPPQRIVSLAPSNTEILFAVGAGEDVVGVTSFDNYPPEADAIQEIGGGIASTISVETIVSLQPDLVVAGDASQQPVIDALEQQNIPVITLEASTFDDVYRNIELVGQATGNPDHAAEQIAQMQQRIEAVSQATATIPENERLDVFYEVFDEPLYTAGPSSFIGQMLEIAGARNIFSDVQEEFPQISAEEVIARNPDVIVSPDMHADQVTPEQITQRPGWQNIAAVEQNRIVLVDGDIVSRPGPRLAEAVETIARALYPDRFN